MSCRVVSCWGSETGYEGSGTEGEGGGGETEGECEQELAVACIKETIVNAWIQQKKKQITALTNHDTLCYYCCSYLQ